MSGKSMLVILLVGMALLLAGVYAAVWPLQFGGKERIQREYEQKQHEQHQATAPQP